MFAEDFSDRILTTVSPGMRAECKWIDDGKYYAGQFLRMVMLRSNLPS